MVRTECIDRGTYILIRILALHELLPLSYSFHFNFHEIVGWTLVERYVRGGSTRSLACDCTYPLSGHGRLAGERRDPLCDRHVRRPIRVASWLPQVRTARREKTRQARQARRRAKRPREIARKTKIEQTRTKIASGQAEDESGVRKFESCDVPRSTNDAFVVTCLSARRSRLRASNFTAFSSSPHTITSP
jgi:hypothetical protein